MTGEKYFLYVGDCTAFPRKEPGHVPDGPAVGQRWWLLPQCGIGSLVALPRASGHVVLAPRWAPGWGFACPIKGVAAGVPCQEESRELGFSHLRAEGGWPVWLLCLLPLRASCGHWHCSCGLFCILLRSPHTGIPKFHNHTDADSVPFPAVGLGQRHSLPYPV